MVGSKPPGIGSPRENNSHSLDQSQVNVTNQDRMAASIKQKPLPNVVIEEEQRPSVLVDQQNGPIRTIEEALDLAKPHSDIYLAEGIYTISKPITIPGLIFDRKDHEHKVYIVGNDGPVCNVVLNQGDYVVFKKIIFLHSGVNILHRFIENAANEPKYKVNPSKQCVAEF